MIAPARSARGMDDTCTDTCFSLQENWSWGLSFDSIGSPCCDMPPSGPYVLDGSPSQPRFCSTVSPMQLGYVLFIFCSVHSSAIFRLSCRYLVKCSNLYTDHPVINSSSSSLGKKKASLSQELHSHRSSVLNQGLCWNWDTPAGHVERSYLAPSNIDSCF